MIPIISTSSTNVGFMIMGVSNFDFNKFSKTPGKNFLTSFSSSPKILTVAQQKRNQQQNLKQIKKR